MDKPKTLSQSIIEVLGLTSLDLIGMYSYKRDFGTSNIEDIGTEFLEVIKSVPNIKPGEILAGSEFGKDARDLLIT